jgi:hypothetical protein
MTEQVSKFKVTDRKSFIEFIELLHEDFCKNSESWQNRDLDHFLEALDRYAKDIQGYYDNTNKKVNADQPTWQVFADIFKGSTIYE